MVMPAVGEQARSPHAAEPAAHHREQGPTAEKRSLHTAQVHYDEGERFSRRPSRAWSGLMPMIFWPVDPITRHLSRPGSRSGGHQFALLVVTPATQNSVAAEGEKRWV